MHILPLPEDLSHELFAAFSLSSCSQPQTLLAFAQDLTLSELDAPSIQRQAALEEIESTLVSNEIDYYPELDQIPLPSAIDTFDDGEVDPLLEPAAVGPIAQGTSETPTILETVTNQDIGDPQETDVIADGAVTDHEQPLAVKFDILLFENLTITSDETEVIDAVNIDIPSESTPNATGESTQTEANQPLDNNLETVEETPVSETTVADTSVAETTVVEVATDTEDQPANQTQDVGSDQQAITPAEEPTQDNTVGDSTETEANQPRENDLETVEETTVAETLVAETTVVEVAADTEDQPANETEDVGSDQQAITPAEEPTQDNTVGDSTETEANQPRENRPGNRGRNDCY